MPLSERPEMYLPENWTSCFDSAKDCYVWDLDGNKLLDMSILEYGNEQIDNAVRRSRLSWRFLKT